MRRARLTDGLFIAAGFVLVIGLGLWMPRMVEGFTHQPITHAGGAARLLSENSALGYVVTALLAFALGICLTVLLYRLRKRRKKDDDDLL